MKKLLTLTIFALALALPQAKIQAHTNPHHYNDGPLTKIYHEALSYMHDFQGNIGEYSLHNAPEIFHKHILPRLQELEAQEDFMQQRIDALQAEESDEVGTTIRLETLEENLSSVTSWLEELHGLIPMQKLQNLKEHFNSVIENAEEQLEQVNGILSKFDMNGYGEEPEPEPKPKKKLQAQYRFKNNQQPAPQFQQPQFQQPNFSGSFAPPQAAQPAPAIPQPAPRIPATPKAPTPAPASAPRIPPVAQK